MWSLVARMLLVFAAWGMVLVAAVWTGLPARTGELACAAGAGLTLLAMGLAPGPRKAASHPAATPSAEERERASV